MARCDQGYICDVCGSDVEDITDSDLYLRYVLGEIDPEVLHEHPERHLRCNPTLAQFIVDDRFLPIEADGFFAKGELDPTFVFEEEARVSLAYRRLHEILGTEGLSITEYPLPGVLEHWSTT